ncbi:BTB POZ domain-containing protein [Musa troglodytarum]|uniref:BTB POZ domain-containing protein n=1 Tax=Musa troglodytarum TaxID=320322 RepID=A0A9E7IBT8_9LILI|nr:BTB POZ domain-containing protein [Musa troglodytarum]
MASATTDGDDVVLELIDPSAVQNELRPEKVTSISTSGVESWNLGLLLQSPSVKVRANRNRQVVFTDQLVEQSAYFRGLLCGSFSESSLAHVSIQWNLEALVHVLQFIHGFQLHITSNNFLLILEAALYFGVERLLLECESWFQRMTLAEGQQIPMDTVIEAWNFGLEQGVGFVPELCKGYLARNFVAASRCIDKPCCYANKLQKKAWVTSSSSFPDIPYDLLHSCIEHPLLTLDSERHLCEALLIWLSNNRRSSQCSSDDSKFDILRKVRIALLPLEFAAGLRRDFSQLGEEAICTILDLMKDSFSIILAALVGDKLDNFRIRLTEYSEKISLAGCIHITALFLFLMVLPSDLDMTAKKRMLKIEDLYCLLQKFPMITEVDMTVDTSPFLLAKVSVISTSIDKYRVASTTPYAILEENSLLLDVAKASLENLAMSNISKLTLEGRNDINDLDLMKISALCGSLSYLSIKGCTMVTDMGISKLISKCIHIKSLILSYTSFGKSSVGVLCSDLLSTSNFTEDSNHKYSCTMAFRLQQLHIDGCKGIDQNSISQLMCHTYMLKILMLRETTVTDDALYDFLGSFLESLDVSETMVSMQALTSIVRRNPGIRCLKATGCTKLNQHDTSDLASAVIANYKGYLFELTQHCILEEVAFGWGFSILSVEELVPLSRLRCITIGLGASPGHHVLCMLPKMCPLLESVILIFQVISDSIFRSIQESLKNLKVLRLCCCLGDLTSFACKISMPQLRVLRLEWVTPWMTNNDLAVLTKNCPNVVEFSLSGCKLLDSASQEIISNGWPGLTFIHLEECGKITLDGVSFLFNCIAIEDFLLRHNGKGIERNFIYQAASKLPLLRKLALDLCDACEGGFDSPSHAERCFLSTVTISRCKSQKCAFDSQTMEAFRSVHKETIVIEWDCKEARTTVVKERI